MSKRLRDNQRLGNVKMNDYKYLYIFGNLTHTKVMDK